MTRKKPPTERERFSEIGKAAQILPAYFRILCRARFDASPPEMLEIARGIARGDIESAQARGLSYPFLEAHRLILEHFEPGTVIETMDDIIGTKTANIALSRVIGVCPMQAHNGSAKIAKSKCWSCPVISQTIQRLKEDIPK